MPIYEYQCQACQHELEALQKISDPLLVECPSCQQPGLRKKVSAAGFRLKGGGWYETDFKSNNRKNLAADSKGGGSGDSSGSAPAKTDGAASSSASAPASSTPASTGSASAP